MALSWIAIRTIENGWLPSMGKSERYVMGDPFPRRGLWSCFNVKRQTSIHVAVVRPVTHLRQLGPHLEFNHNLKDP